MRDVISLTSGSTEREPSKLDRNMERLPLIQMHTEFISAKQIFRLSQEATNEYLCLRLSAINSESLA